MHPSVHWSLKLTWLGVSLNKIYYFHNLINNDVHNYLYTIFYAV